MKYPTIGLITLFLRSLAETLEKNNNGETETTAPSESITGEPVDAPKRTRRTKEQIAADSAAAEAAKNTGATVTQPKVEITEEAIREVREVREEQEAKQTAEDLEKLYQERRKAFDPLITCTPSRVDEVKAVLRKYTDSPNANRDLPPQHHAAFLKDIEALKL